jgi:alkane 1-monooxygenase
MASAIYEATAVLLPGSTSRIFARHLVSLLLPGLSLAFLWTGPHAWYVAPLFMAPMVALFAFDTGPWQERRQPLEGTPSWPFDTLAYLLAALQLVIVFELCRMYQHQAIFSVDTVMTFLVVGGSSGFSIITAHELIHRKSLWPQQLGRLLLCTVLYEHFYTEHLRGHHVRVGRPEDPATASFGETYEGFFRRTAPAQFRSAWRLEARRLGDENMRLLDPRMLRNRILHGIAVEWGMAAAVWAAFGVAAFVAFLLQAFMAIRLLEAVNYFEHWGLRRRKARVRPQDSWDTHSWFT